MRKRRDDITARIPQETLDRVRKQMSCKWYCNGGECGKGLPGTPCELVGCVAWEENKEDKKMNGWKLTKVWQVDHKLVVANTVEEAVALFKAYMGNDYRDEPREIRAISTNTMFREYNALIKEKEQ